MRALLALLLFVSVSCTRSQNRGPLKPVEMVNLFVQMSAEAKDPSDKKKLAAMCQGRMLKAFESLSDDRFMVSYVNQPIKIKSFQMLGAAEDGNLARVHYQVQIENPNGQDLTQEISEREVELLRVNGQWYLEAIRPKGSDQIAFTRGMIF